jgi:hypothetical protein
MKTRFVPLMVALAAGAVYGGAVAHAAAPMHVAFNQVSPEDLEGLGLTEEEFYRQPSASPAAQTAKKKPVAKLQLSADNINFDNVKVGKSAKRTLKLKNVGADTVVVIMEESTDPAFVGTPLNKELTIKPGKSRTVHLTFTPTEKKQYIGKMPVNVIAPGTARLRVRVTGRGK